ncbi:MAG TPA: hypothetical protein DCY88_14590 [Cyanobacteria bacterium UBA11372]|nr:hypothetical protein [Cyanobacteria bacterium UBA11372]
MTIKSYAESETRSPRGKENGSDSDSDYSDCLRSAQEDEANSASNQRRGGAGTAFKGSNASPVGIALNGKLARQLRTTLESQLAEYTLSREKAVERILTYDKKIAELQQELESLQQIIEQLDQIEEEAE